MTTADPWLNRRLLEQPPQPWLRRAGGAVRAFASTSRRKALIAAAKALVVTIRGRFSVAQVLGGGTASVGTFIEWGTGVGLLATGLAVVLAATVLERQAD
jgi:hypothetical protein